MTASEEVAELTYGSGTQTGPASPFSELLDQIGICRPYTLFVMFATTSVWALAAMSTMAPSFMAPTDACMGPNCTFTTVQNEFSIAKSVIDPGEMTFSVNFLGNLFMGQIYASLADRIGRHSVLCASLVLSGVIGSLGAIAQSFWVLLLCRFFQGSFFTSLTALNWVMCTESISERAHGFASVLLGVFWVTGYCIVSPIAANVTSWRTVQLLTSFPALPWGILMYYLVPESLGYLVQKKKHIKVAKWIAKSKSEVKVDYAKLDKEVDNGIEESTFCLSLRRVLSTKSLVVCTSVETLIWIIDFMVYNGLSLLSTGIGFENVHASYVFSGLIELPSYILLPFAFVKIGRKLTVVTGHFVAAIALVFMFLYGLESNSVVFFIAWLTAKFAATWCFMSCFVCGAELFPTGVRGFCLGICSTLANLGAMVAPHVMALDEIYNGLSLNFYVACCVMAAILATFLPAEKTITASSYNSKNDTLAKTNEKC